MLRVCAALGLDAQKATEPRVCVAWRPLRQRSWGRIGLFRGQPSGEANAIIHVGGEKGWSGNVI